MGSMQVRPPYSQPTSVVRLWEYNGHLRDHCCLGDCHTSYPPWWVRVYKPSLSTAVKNAHPWKLNSVMSVIRGPLTPYVPTYFLGWFPSPKRLRDESCWGLGPLYDNVWYTLNCTWLWCPFRRMSIITMKQPVYQIYIDYLLHVNIPNMRQLSIPSCRFSIILLCR